MVNLVSSFEQIMMGPSPQCYIPSHKVIGPLVLEKKIFEGFLPYMGVAAILVMWPTSRKQTLVLPSHWGSVWNLALTSQAVLEKKIFENGGLQTMAILIWNKGTAFEATLHNNCVDEVYLQLKGDMMNLKT